MSDFKVKIEGRIFSQQAVKLIEEIEMLNKAGVNVDGRLWISPRSHLIMPYHKMLDGLYEEAKGAGATGTTRRGIGPVFADKVSYNGLRIYELLNWDSFVEKFIFQANIKNKILKTTEAAPAATQSQSGNTTIAATKNGLGVKSLAQEQLDALDRNRANSIVAA